MPAYEICYLEDDGALACAFSVVFDSAMRAKILAHAMKPADCRTLEVWQGKELVYRRPEAGIETASMTMRPHLEREPAAA